MKTADDLLVRITCSIDYTRAPAHEEEGSNPTTTSQNRPYGFQMVAQLPNRHGGHVISVYAYSAVNGGEVSVSIPVTIK